MRDDETDRSDRSDRSDRTHRLTFMASLGGAPLAYVYPVDAGSFTLPLGVFPLDPAQELPRCPVGDVYTFDQPLSPGHEVAATAPDGTRVVSAGPASVVPHVVAPLFAERGPGVLAHPEVTGSSAAWRQAGSLSPLTPGEWEQFLTNQRRSARRSVALAGGFAAAYLVLLIVLEATDTWRGLFGPAIFAVRFAAASAAVGIASAVVAWRASRRLATLAAARAQREGPSCGAFVRVWWCVGSGTGPVGMVTAASRPDPGPNDLIGHAAVVNLRPGAVGDGWQTAQLVLDPATGRWIGLSIVDGFELWPQEPWTPTLSRRRRRPVRF